MDLLPAILGARSFDRAITQVQDATGSDRMAAWREIGRVVTEVGWALLIAPELWCVLEEWFACRRLEADLDAARDARDRLQRGIAEPRTMVVVETRTGKVVARPEGLIGETKIGPDMLSTRVAAMAQITGATTKAEAEWGRRRKALHEYVQAYQARVLVVEGMTLQQQAAALMRLSLVQGQQALAFELAQVATKNTAGANVSGLLESLASRVKPLFGGTT